MRLVDSGSVDQAQWDAFVEGHPMGSFWHTSEWVDYQAELSVNMSQALMDGNEIIGVMPLFWDKGVLAVEGEPGPLPLFKGKDSADVGLELLSRVEWWSRARFRSPPFDGKPDTGFHSRMIDVSEPPAKLWTRVRKSYQSLANQGAKDSRLTMVVGTEMSLGLAYQDAHLSAGGSRPQATYASQISWLSKGMGFVAAAWTNQAVVGAIYVILYKGWAYYASGPSTQRNVQHALQWRVVQELCRRPTAIYEIGWQHHAQDKKGQNIEFYKRGWGGRDWGISTWDVRRNNIHGLASSCF